MFYWQCSTAGVSVGRVGMESGSLTGCCEAEGIEPVQRKYVEEIKLQRDAVGV